MNIDNLDLMGAQNPYSNYIETNMENPYSNYIEPNLENQHIYNTYNNDIINVIEEEENDLKYNKYIYEYNMANSNNTKNTQNLDGLNNLASLGLNLVGSIIDTAAPLVQDISNKMKEFEDNVHEDFKKRQTPNSDNSSKKPTHYQHEDDNYLYFVVELPRVKKEDCEIKFIKAENVIQIIGKTELNVQGFSFLENKELELKLKVSPDINISGTNIEASHRNGVLYISISKSLINLNNININILS